MEKRRRNFTKLKTEYSYEGFCNFCKDVAERYANSDAEFARSYYCRTLNISEACFYRVLEFAVVMNLVSDEIFYKMREKAIKNQKAHAPNAGIASLEKYGIMYEQRCKYIAYAVQVEDVRKFALEYIEKNKISKKDLAKEYGYSTRVADILLVRSIEEGIITDEQVDEMQERCVIFSPGNFKILNDFFSGLKKKRKAFLTNNIQSKI